MATPRRPVPRSRSRGSRRRQRSRATRPLVGGKRTPPRWHPRSRSLHAPALSRAPTARPTRTPDEAGPRTECGITLAVPRAATPASIRTGHSRGISRRLEDPVQARAMGVWSVCASSPHGEALCGSNSWPACARRPPAVRDLPTQESGCRVLAGTALIAGATGRRDPGSGRGGLRSSPPGDRAGCWPAGAWCSSCRSAWPGRCSARA